VGYLLLADHHVFSCPNWDALVDKLVWARGEGYAIAKARRCSAFTDRPLIPSEAVALVEAATALALGTEATALEPCAA
jgi:hypothetical protein